MNGYPRFGWVDIVRFQHQVIRLRRIPFIISAAETDEDIRAKAIEAFQSLRKEAETSMEPEMTLDEINAEINAVREARTQTV